MQRYKLINHTQHQNNHILSLKALKSYEMFQGNKRICFKSGLALTIRVTRYELKLLYGAWLVIHASPPLYWERNECYVQSSNLDTFRFRFNENALNCLSASLRPFLDHSSKKYDCLKRCLEMYYRNSCLLSMTRSKKLWTLFGDQIFHLATEVFFLAATWRLHQKVNFGPLALIILNADRKNREL